MEMRGEGSSLKVGWREKRRRGGGEGEGDGEGEVKRVRRVK